MRSSLPNFGEELLFCLEIYTCGYVRFTCGYVRFNLEIYPDETAILP